jgi:hypothetical protein
VPPDSGNSIAPGLAGLQTAPTETLAKWNLSGHVFVHFTSLNGDPAARVTAVKLLADEGDATAQSDYREYLRRVGLDETQVKGGLATALSLD